MADTTQLQWLLDAVNQMRQNRPAQNPVFAGQGNQVQSMQNYLGDLGTKPMPVGPPQASYSMPGINITPRNFNTTPTVNAAAASTLTPQAAPSAVPQATIQPSSYSSGTSIPVRSTIEGIYGKGSVNYDPSSRAIYLFDPRTGRTGTIAAGSYSDQGGTAYINPNDISSWLNPKPVAPSERLNTASPYQPYLTASTPGFANMVNLVQSWQEANPVYMPFPAGTPTLDREKYNEAVRQYNLGYGLDVRRQNETERHNKVSEALTSAKSSGTGTGKMSDSATKAFNKGAAMQMIKNKVDEAWKRGGWAAAADSLPGIQDWFMGTYYPELTRGGLDNNDIKDILTYTRNLIGGDLSKIPFPQLSDKNTSSGGAPVSIAPNTGNPQ